VDKPPAELKGEVDVALSLAVGLEYPMGGLNRDMLKQARSALEAARNEGLPST
jgi:hypothetical protein